MFASLTIKPSKLLGDSFVAIVLVQKSFFFLFLNLVYFIWLCFKPDYLELGRWENSD